MIRLEGIDRSFQVGGEWVHALREISLEIPAGDYVAIMGPSGSGKSTLLNVIGLLDRPDRGRYLLGGVDAAGLTEEGRADLRRDKIGFVFQSFHLISRLTAAENVELPLVLAGTEPRVREARVAELLQQLNLSDRARHRPDQLSGGQRQRVAIARALAMRPAVLLADEPTGNLDLTSGREVVEILEGMNAKGITLLVVTHDPAIGGRAHRRIRMVDGLVEEGA
ncbi:MAG: ABC transporter ATP-binding protein [Gammaproteobacteria bacterium]|nr:ABC transporter ATP-binding protein [Gammaproteobacteria bacterium]MBU1653771.1 ABC transporter ATP-binding protein [Gammaproteobacteria bacterium]MBU1962113.1 ABC transporter ATP-binding protein [Gammaproteobacteria bacterium]